VSSGKASHLVLALERTDLPGRRCEPNPEDEWYENAQGALAVEGDRRIGVR
jgi:hypothetical protein